MKNQNLYANAQLADSDADYIWCNVYNWNGQPGGDVYIGDLDGKHLFVGTPSSLVINSDGTATVEAAGSYTANRGNASGATLTLRLLPGNKLSFEVAAGSLSWVVAPVSYPAGAVIIS